MGASTIAATVTDPALFRNGREFAVWLGMTPKQNSSGGKEKLGRTSKRGDKYIRCLLVTGAIAVLRHTRTRTTKDAGARIIGPKTDETCRRGSGQQDGPHRLGSYNAGRGLPEQRTHWVGRLTAARSTACEGEGEMMASGRAADRKGPGKSKRNAARILDRDPISEFHHGQRSYAPHRRAGHMTAPDHIAKMTPKTPARGGHPHMICCFHADSDEDAHPFRFDGARDSDMMSPIWHRLAG